jgi:OOP family OmpA-OmpF porin
MKKIMLRWAAVFSVALAFTSGSFAQDSVMRTTTVTEVQPPLFSGTKGYRVWSIGLHGGAMGPFSAFGGRNDFSDWKSSFGYGAYLKMQASHAIGFQLDFLRGKLRGDNSNNWAGQPPVSPYKSFETQVHWATSLSGVLTLGNISWSQLRTSIQPYVSIGGGAINYSPVLTTNAGATVNFATDNKQTDFFVPLGMGIKASLSQGINLDLGYTVGFVDGDAIDGYYKEPYNSDKFSYAHLGLEFALGNKSKPQLSRHNPPAQLAQEMRSSNDALRASIAAGEERYNQRLAEMNALRDEMARMKADSDGDGVSDYFDKCPGTPAGTKVDGAGCALPTPPAPVKDTVVQQTTTYVITEEDRSIANEAFRNLEFDFAKSTIRPRSFPYLNKLADLLVKKGISLKLGGHTDNVGSDAANMKLSKDRAESVKSYLVAQGANPSRIEAVGYGESQPIATNGTAAGRQKNRRVEFTLY